MLKIERYKLSFMELFSKLSSEVRYETDKFMVESDERNVYFYQFFDGIEILAYTNNYSDCKDYKELFETKGFSSRIKVGKNTEVCFDDNQVVRFSGNSKWNFEKLEPIQVASNFSLVEYFKKFSSDSFEKTTLSNLKNLKYVSRSIGGDKLNVVRFTNGYAMSSNYNDLSSIAKLEESAGKDWNHIIPSVLIHLTQYFSVETLEIYRDDSINRFVIPFKKDDVSFMFFIPYVEDSTFPDLLNEQLKAEYYHKHKVVINKENLSEALHSVVLSTVSSMENRIMVSLSVKDKILCLECSDSVQIKDGSIKSKPIVKAKVEENVDVESIDAGLENLSFALSGRFLQIAVDSVDSKNVILRLDSNMKDKNAISVMSEDENQIYIPILYTV